MSAPHNLIAPALVAAIFSTAAVALDYGDAAAPNFAAYCSAPLPPDRQGSFDRNLGAAEKALAAGDIDAAQRAVSEAYSASYRGGPEWDVGVKCLGRATAQRWHAVRLDLKRQ